MEHASIRHLNPLEFPDWDARLKHFPAATFFHSAAWARVLHSTYGYRPVYFATEGVAHKIESLFPLMEVNSWLTGKRGISLPFTDECEPLGPDDDSFRRLFSAAQVHAQTHRWKYLESRGGLTLLDQAPASSSFYSHKLELQPDETALFSSLDSSVRRAVRKAEQSEVTIEFSQSLEAVRSFHTLLCLTRQRHGVPPQPFPFFANIQRHVLAQNQGWVVLAKHKNIPVAGAVYFLFGQSVIYKYGASNEAFQQLRANNLVMWEAIRRFAREGFTSFDFGRTSLDNDGLRRFKLGWGTRETQIHYVRYDLKAAAFVAAGDQSPGWYTRIFKRLPISLSRLVGVALYRHIA